jgi:hypothetical protein
MTPPPLVMHSSALAGCSQATMASHSHTGRHLHILLLLVYYYVPPRREKQ